MSVANRGWKGKIRPNGVIVWRGGRFITREDMSHRYSPPGSNRVHFQPHPSRDRVYTTWSGDLISYPETLMPYEAATCECHQGERDWCCKKPARSEREDILLGLEEYLDLKYGDDTYNPLYLDDYEDWHADPDLWDGFYYTEREYPIDWGYDPDYYDPFIERYLERY